MENKCQVNWMFSDFSKVFDEIILILLITKLKTIEYYGIIMQWIEIYVRGCSQIIKQFLLKIRYHIRSSQESTLFSPILNDADWALTISQFLILFETWKYMIESRMSLMPFAYCCILNTSVIGKKLMIWY